MCLAVITFSDGEVCSVPEEAAGVIAVLFGLGFSFVGVYFLQCN